MLQCVWKHVLGWINHISFIKERGSYITELLNGCGELRLGCVVKHTLNLTHPHRENLSSGNCSHGNN